MTGDGTTERGSKPPRTLFSLGREGSKRRRGGTDVAEADDSAAVGGLADEPTDRLCAECGAELIGGAAFCGECGMSVGDVGVADPDAGDAGAAQLIDEDLELDEDPQDLIDEDLGLDAELEPADLIDENLEIGEATLALGAVDDELVDDELVDDELIEDEDLIDGELVDDDVDDDDEENLVADAATDDDEEQTESGLVVLAAARDEAPDAKTDAGEKKKAPVGWIIGGVAAALLIVVGIVALSGSGGDNDGDLASTESTTSTARRDRTTTSVSTTTTQPTTTTTAAPETTTTVTPVTAAPQTTVLNFGPGPTGPATPAALRVAGVSCGDPCTISPGGLFTVTLVNDGGSAGAYSLNGNGQGLQGPNGALAGHSSVSLTVRDTVGGERTATLTITGAGGLNQTVKVLVQ